jgi:hypothetical protein
MKPIGTVQPKKNYSGQGMNMESTGSKKGNGITARTSQKSTEQLKQIKDTTDIQDVQRSVEQGRLCQDLESSTTAAGKYVMIGVLPGNSAVSGNALRIVDQAIDQMENNLEQLNHSPKNSLTRIGRELVTTSGASVTSFTVPQLLATTDSIVDEAKVNGDDDELHDNMWRIVDYSRKKRQPTATATTSVIQKIKK